MGLKVRGFEGKVLKVATEKVVEWCRLSEKDTLHHSDWHYSVSTLRMIRVMLHNSVSQLYSTVVRIPTVL